MNHFTKSALLFGATLTLTLGFGCIETLDPPKTVRFNATDAPQAEEVRPDAEEPKKDAKPSPATKKPLSNKPKLSRPHRRPAETEKQNIPKDGAGLESKGLGKVQTPGGNYRTQAGADSHTPHFRSKSRKPKAPGNRLSIPQTTTWRQRPQELDVVNGKPFHDMFFKHYGTNPTIDTEEEPTSTFAVDVDNASYALARSYLNRNHLPAEEAVRVEEFVNSFKYNYEAPNREAFSVQVEAVPSPNRQGYHVVHVGLKGKEVHAEARKAANLVFVIDVSGSMDREDRLGLVKRSLGLLTDQLTSNDSVGIVVYGSRAHTVLEPIYATHSGKERIRRAISSLSSEGATNAQAGILLGYKMAARHARRGQINRVILCSDGVANNGITGAGAIFKTIKNESDQGVTISTVGFGMGNYNDVLMEKLANVGNGNYNYVDRIEEARRIFVENMTGTLQVIAKDVKIQVQWNDQAVARYRLLGFENRLLKKQDFDNDRVDAGEIGAGHAVTALYEVKFKSGGRFQNFAKIRIRHKAPEGQTSALIEKQLPYSIVRSSYEKASPPTKLSLVAAAFAEKLRGSYWVRNMSYQNIMTLYNQIPGPLAQRPDVVELGQLIGRAQSLDSRKDKFEHQAPIAQMDFDRVPILR